jgi:hypothetical protein
MKTGLKKVGGETTGWWTVNCYVYGYDCYAVVAPEHDFIKKMYKIIIISIAGHRRGEIFYSLYS